MIARLILNGRPVQKWYAYHSIIGGRIFAMFNGMARIEMLLEAVIYLLVGIVLYIARERLRIPKRVFLIPPAIWLLGEVWSVLYWNRILPWFGPLRWSGFFVYAFFIACGTLLAYLAERIKQNRRK